MSKSRPNVRSNANMRNFHFLVTREYTEKACVNALNKTQALDMLTLVLNGHAENDTKERVNIDGLNSCPYGETLNIDPVKRVQTKGE